ncbi:MAG TPA: phosphoglycerate dehydrogenase [bacterium]|nr:phosphoglycerate dehydrogenase [bacterium]
MPAKKQNQPVFLEGDVRIVIDNIIFNFDSTLIHAEGVELILEQALQRQKSRQRAALLERLAQISMLADLGETSVADALHQCFALARVTRADVTAVAARVLETLNPRVIESVTALQQAGKHIFIFSTGFEELVRPVTRALHVDDDHVFTNQLIYDFKGEVVGFNEKNPLFLSAGKGFLIEQLRNDGRLPGGTAIVGRSASDLAIRKNNIARIFVYFANARIHEEIRRQADYVVDRFDHLLPLFFSEEELSNEGIQLFYAQNGHVEAAAQPTILLLENVHEEAVRRFRSEGLEPRMLKGALRNDELCTGAGDIHILGIRSQTRVTARVLAAMPELWAIGAFCIGTNQIDLAQAAKSGIPVFNAPYSNTRSVAELVVGEIIMLMRRIPEKSQAAHAGSWLKSSAGCSEIRGKTVGIIGYGHIGSQVSVLLESLGMSVCFHDIVDKLPLGNAHKSASLEELLSRADVVTLHVPDTPATRNLIGAAQLRRMKKGAILLNSSRGRVVDLAALRAALDKGVLAGAAVDVFPEEPDQTNESFSTPLQGAANTILTPHIGGSTEEAQVSIARYVSEKLLRFIQTGATTGAINFPEVELPRVAQTHRILHVHYNVPGVLAKINNLFARRSINVAGQLLQTRGEIGYLIVDVDQQVSGQVLDLMGHIAETIKVRKIA